MCNCEVDFFVLMIMMVMMTDGLRACAVFDPEICLEEQFV